MLPAIVSVRGKRMTFGGMLRGLRVKADLTQEQLAEAAGLSVGAVRNHEQGQRKPSWEAVVSYARALNVPTGEFDDCDEVKTSRPVEEPKKAKQRAKK